MFKRYYKKTIFLLLPIVLVCCIFNLLINKRYSIAPKELANELKEYPEKIILIDIRDYNDYVKGHIPNAVNIYSAQVENIKNLITSEKSTILYCYNGNLSERIALCLRNEGFKVLFLEGGWDNGWLPYLSTDGT